MHAAPRAHRAPVGLRIGALRVALAAVVLLAVHDVALGQEPAAPSRAPAPATAPTAAASTPFTLEIGAFYQALDHGYTDWQGEDLRLSYSGTRVSPFLGISRQVRGPAHQVNYGLGSYITLGRRTYSIVGVSSAPGGNAILHPRLRWDASLLTDSRIVPGLVLAVGYTHLSFGGGSTGEIASLGSILYRGPLIASAGLHLNHDGVGGANSASGEVGAQYGSQGHRWIGGRLSAGHEAYQILSATPFDVRYNDIGASAFCQQWITRRTAITLRADYEEKLTAYHRGGLAVTYAVAF